jgi:nucleotidyltransferase/DNA polymerase involved in DNA repair
VPVPSPQDCFYASVFEHENPALRSLPLAVQQKQIVVTCNYEARRRGLRKLQLIHEAKKACPDVVIVLGEDLTRFRNASKELYAFLRSFSWNSRCERLGFDEVCRSWSSFSYPLSQHRHFLNLILVAEIPKSLTVCLYGEPC